MPKQFKSWWDYMTFSHAVKHKSRFVHDKVVTAFLDTLLQTSKTRHRHIPADRYVWRAQSGAVTEIREQDDVEYDELVPYPVHRMKPLPYSAHEGRVNPKGIPCLYVATDKETAMSEVRPSVGDKISLAQLRLTRELTLIDFSVGHENAGTPLFLEEPSPKKRENAVWTHVDQAFSKPVTTDHATAEYVPTQIIAEHFKNSDFDGVVYKSRLGPGYNLALFNVDVAEVVSCSLQSVKSVNFEFNPEHKGYSIKT